MPRAIALSRAARELITRRLAGEDVEMTDLNRRAYQRLAEAGFAVPGTTRLTPEAHARHREFLPTGAPLSAGAVEVLRAHLDGCREVNDGNRAAHRELAAEGFMIAGHSFAQGDESVYRMTEAGWARRFELAEIAHAKASA